MRRDGEGKAYGTFILPEAQAAMLEKALKALAAPKHVRATEGAGAYDYEKPTPQKMGQAFMDYIERYPTDRLPKLGGMAATIVVTAEAEVFTQGAHKAGTTDTGVKVSRGQLRRWACMSKMLPAVLDTEGHVLDLGRSHGFHTSRPTRVTDDAVLLCPFHHQAHAHGIDYPLRTWTGVLENDERWMCHAAAIRRGSARS